MKQSAEAQRVILWDKGQVTEEDKDTVRLYTEKMRRTKAQLGLNPGTAIKDNF